MGNHGMWFPVLAKIAEDFFSFVQVRRHLKLGFGRVANLWRNTVEHKSTQATLCLKSWYVMPELRDCELLGQ